MRFWDSSALMPLVVEEPFSAQARRIYGEDPVLVAWWATIVECESGLRRAARAGRLTARAVVHAVERVEALLSQAHVVLPVEMIRSRACRLIRRHPLSAADALQLAAAWIWAQGAPEGGDFVCLDDRLRAAAGAEGFRVLPE